MTATSEAPSRLSLESYSPQLRTALVLTGTGTAGAYHAGVLRALHEAGVKIDVVAGQGMGVVSALFAAVDGAQKLWEEKGFWRSPAIRTLYPWRPMLRAMVWALAVSIALVVLPIAAIALGLIVFPIDFMLKMVGAGGTNDLAATYLRFAEASFAADGLPTWLPRLVVLVLGFVVVLAFVDGWTGSGGRTERGSLWWRVLRAPLSSKEAADHCWRLMWDLLRGAATLKQPTASELARRYTDLICDNLGQPGFRELVVAVHDLDARRDLILAVVAEPRRRDLVRRQTSEATEERRAEVFDLTGVAREYLVDIVDGALTIPVVTEPTTVTFSAEAYWRGETHRICDRPASIGRLFEELLELGAEQLIVVSAAPETHGPHALSPARLDLHGRVGDYVQSAEAATVRDLTRLVAYHSVRVFPVRPAHNPIGPFDFSGGFDNQSDRRRPLHELMAQGYEDAYHQFIEPVVGASGELLKLHG
jgi:hypothetical protein